MHFLSALLGAANFPHLLLASSTVAGALNKKSLATDPRGYILPMDGTASTTIFALRTELSRGTACGVNALPSNQSIGSSPGTGPGYLYAALNQLAFGANPVAHAGGPGAACGLCYALTPVSAAGVNLTAQETTFMIIDECPADEINYQHCGQCDATAQNTNHQTFHFDIAADAMSSAQYQNFIADATDGSNWEKVYFSQVECTAAANTKPVVNKHWGCLENCKNNSTASVCQDVKPPPVYKQEL